MPSRTLETWPHGAIMQDAQHTRFALWAPDAFYVSVELHDGQSLPMQPQAEGWFVAYVRCGAGTRYHYNIDGKLDVPDPASRLQYAGVQGDSVQLRGHGGAGEGQAEQCAADHSHGWGPVGWG